MSIIVFIIVTLIANWFLSDDSGLCIVVGLGAAIWFCLTRNTWKEIVEGVRDGLHGKPDSSNESISDKNEINAEEKS